MKQKPGSGRKSRRTNKPGRTGKLKFHAAYVAKRRSEAAREGEKKPFGGSALFGVTTVKKERPTQEDAPKMSHHMLDSLEGYLDNITVAATQTADNG